MKKILRKKIMAFTMVIAMIAGMLPFNQIMSNGATLGAAKTEKSLENGMKVVQLDGADATVTETTNKMVINETSSSGGIGSTQTLATYVYIPVSLSGDFKVTADVTVNELYQTGTAGGVYMGAFDDVNGQAAFVAVAMRGDGKFNLYRTKADGSFGGIKGNSVYYNTPIINKSTLSLERSATMYKATANKNDGSAVENLATKADDVKATLLTTNYNGYIAVAVCGARVTVENLKIVNGNGDVVYDQSTKVVNNIDAPRKVWSTVEKPLISNIALSEDGSVINVPITTYIGHDGADLLELEVYKDSTLVKTILYRTRGTGTGTIISYKPDLNGSYSFKVTAKRTGETDVIVSDTVEYGAFKLPLAIPTITSIRSAGKGVVDLNWGIAQGAEQYEVLYKLASASDTTYVSTGTTTELTKEISNLSVGSKYTFKVLSIRGTDVSDPAIANIQVTAEAQREWNYSAFGSGISTTNSTVSGNLNSDGQVTLHSDGGKIIPATTDGLLFYYTKINPSENFELSATLMVDKWTLSNGQEGFGLMAADRVGVHGDSLGNQWNNSIMTTVTKVDYWWNTETNELADTGIGNNIVMKLGIGAQEKTGATNDNMALLTANSDNYLAKNWSSILYPLDTTCGNLGKGQYNLIGKYTNAEAPTGTVQNLTEIRLTIKMDNTGYHCIYTDAQGVAHEQIFYDKERDNLTKMDPNNINVGFFTSRNAHITFKDVSLTTSDAATDAPAKDRPIKDVTPQYKVTSATSTGIEDYKLVFATNADGVLNIKDAQGNVVVENTAMLANTTFEKAVKLTKGKNDYIVSYKANDEYKPGEYKKMETYDEITFTHSVDYKTYGTPGQSIWVSPDGSPTASGNEKEPMDIYTAVKYIQSGQMIVLKGGRYNLDTTFKIDRGISGTENSKMYMVADPNAKERPVFDFGKVASGATFAGDYWYFQGFDVTNSMDYQKGIQLSGSNCTLDQVNTYYNGNSGLQISRYLSSDPFELWPANNLILNCTSYGNADRGYEDADGFAAKLTCGEGNVFRGCIAHHNADDGWDLFAKIESGPIGVVVIDNCIAYANGYLEDGTIAGNGNGFKMGGSNMSGHHELINSISYDNKAKGIDSNSCPDVKVKNCTSFNNGGSNVALYTSGTANTDFTVDGVISFRTNYLTVEENLRLGGTQDSSKVYKESNYYWDGKTQKAGNTLNVVAFAPSYAINTNSETGAKVFMPSLATVSQTDINWFEHVDTSLVPTRDIDGSINMHGLLTLTSFAPTAVGARLVATPSNIISIGESVKGIESIKTGDETNFPLYLVVAILSGSVFVLSRKRKKLKIKTQ